MKPVACEFDSLLAGGRCKTCGHTIDRDFPKGLYRYCGTGPQRSGIESELMSCRWLGEHVADTQPKTCGCKSGAWGAQASAVFACELHGLCSPLCTSKDKAIEPCNGCESYAASPSV